jgi:hypothetical protein
MGRLLFIQPAQNKRKRRHFIYKIAFYVVLTILLAENFFIYVHR